MQTYEYAKTILSLMTQEKHPEGEYLLFFFSFLNFNLIQLMFF